MRYATWVKTGESPYFPFTSIPAYAVIPMAPCLVYMRFWTIGMATILTILIWRLAKKGYTLTWLINRIKGRFSGNRYSARPHVYIRRFSRTIDVTKD